jgi:1-acyl-sn-glycerol-3-phosphate acyltransferase
MAPPNKRGSATTAKTASAAKARTAGARRAKTAKTAKTAKAAPRRHVGGGRFGPAHDDPRRVGGRGGPASGERARRRGTPLIAVPTPTDAHDRRPDRRHPWREPTDHEEPPAHGGHARPRGWAQAPAAAAPRATKPTARVLAREGGRRREPPRPVRPLRPVPDPPLPSAEPQPTPRPAAVRPGETSRLVAPGVEDLVQAGVAALRAVVAASGVEPQDVERQVASTLAFLRRRLTGDFEVDDFGFDEDFTTSAYLPLLRPLYKSWFRVEVRGIENIPAEGGGLVVSNHSGTFAFDSLMTQVAVYDETPTHRHLRMLGADFVFQTPMVSQVARKSGSTLATTADAELLLSSGELVGVWPEGFKGIGKPFSERYKLQRFGRGGFVANAIRAGVPIIPCSIVGAEEIYPMIGNMKTLARLLGAPYAPVTPTWPLLGPLGMIPLPSKWLIEFGVPVQTADLGPGAADDPMLIFDLTDQTRETIQQTLYSLLMQRRSVFF